MVVFCISLISCFLGRLLRYCLTDLEMVRSVTITIIIIISSSSSSSSSMGWWGAIVGIVTKLRTPGNRVQILKWVVYFSVLQNVQSVTVV